MIRTRTDCRSASKWGEPRQEGRGQGAKAPPGLHASTAAPPYYVQVFTTSLLPNAPIVRSVSSLRRVPDNIAWHGNLSS